VCEHSCQTKVENISHIINESVACTLISKLLGGVTEFGALAQ
jgi:hypothetical protein